VRRVPLAALTAITVSMTLGVSACTDNSDPLGLGTADRGSVTEIVDASASVTAKAVATLTAPSPGSLAQLAVTPGQQVAVGQVIAVIDSPSAQQQLTEASAALAAARNTGGGGGGLRTGDLAAVQKKTDEQAAAAFAKARTAAGAIGDPVVRDALVQQIDAAAGQYEALSSTARTLVGAVARGLASLSSAIGALGAAQRAQAQSAYNLAKSTVDALTLRAPIAGVVQLGGTAAPAQTGSLSSLLSSIGGGGATTAATNSSGRPTGPGVDDAVGVGAPVGTGTAVATIVDTSALGLLADVDETDILLVAPGVRARVELDAAPGASYDAAVGSVDVLPTTSARGGVAYRVRLALGAGRFSDGRAAPTPRPGMSAVVHLSVREARDVVTVPAAAVVRADGRDAVWLIRDGKAQRVPVTLGVQGPDRVQVSAGLAAGDQVVVRGADRVTAGQAVP
jgi:multidrug efflux pump subunit AcrA (membrane-fusion protein)